MKSALDDDCASLDVRRRSSVDRGVDRVFEGADRGKAAMATLSAPDLRASTTAARRAPKLCGHATADPDAPCDGAFAAAAELDIDEVGVRHRFSASVEAQR
jgi:hypothetical protein